MRGRKPTPTQLRVLEGNPGRRPLRKNEPKPPAGDVACPDYLVDDLARAAWAELAPALLACGILTPLDRDLLASFCQARANIQRCLADLDYLNSRGRRAFDSELNKVLTEYRQHATLLTKTGAALGMAPAERARLPVSPEKIETIPGLWKPERSKIS